MSKNQETLDFSNVEAAEGGGLYLRPGIYSVKPSKVELSAPEGKTPCLKISFTAISGEYDGQSVEERFFLSPKALPRLQYLHEKYLGFKLENKAISLEQLEDYFSKKLTVKPKTIVVRVEGEENEGKVYGRLPYADFIIEDSTDVEEGAYEEGSEQYRKSVRKSRNASTGSSAAVLSSPVVQESKLPWDN